MSLPTVLASSVQTQGDRPHLLAQCCKACGVTTFPIAVMCSRCGHDGLERVELSGSANVFSWTQIHRGGAGMKTPYIVALADFESGPRLFAQVHAEPAQMRTGMPVKLAFGVPPAGAPADAYYFVPAAP